MRRGKFPLLAVLAAVVLLAAAGAITVFAIGPFGPNRQAMASQTVRTYWTDIAHGKVGQAYTLMTPGNQAARPYKDYSTDMYSFLIGTGGIQVRVGTPSVKGDYAVVPVTLHSPKSSQDLNAYQHLFWYDGDWRISDANGGLSHTR